MQKFKNFEAKKEQIEAKLLNFCKNYFKIQVLCCLCYRFSDEKIFCIFLMNLKKNCIFLMNLKYFCIFLNEGIVFCLLFSDAELF